MEQIKLGDREFNWRPVSGYVWEKCKEFFIQRAGTKTPIALTVDQLAYLIPFMYLPKDGKSRMSEEEISELSRADLRGAKKKLFENLNVSEMLTEISEDALMLEKATKKD